MRRSIPTVRSLTPKFTHRRGKAKATNWLGQYKHNPCVPSLLSLSVDALLALRSLPGRLKPFDLPPSPINEYKTFAACVHLKLVLISSLTLEGSVG